MILLLSLSVTSSLYPLNSTVSPTSGTSSVCDKVIGADAFVAVYDPFDDSRAVHAAIKIGDRYYDAKGERTKKGIQNHVSYLKPNDFNEEVCQTYDEMWDHIINNYCIEIPSEEIDRDKVFPYANKSTVDSIVSHLRDILEDLELT